MSFTDPLTFALAALVGLALFIVTIMLDLRRYIADPTPDKHHHDRYNLRVTSWLLLIAGVLLIGGVFGLVFAIIYNLTN